MQHRYVSIATNAKSKSRASAAMALRKFRTPDLFCWRVQGYEYEAYEYGLRVSLRHTQQQGNEVGIPRCPAVIAALTRDQMPSCAPADAAAIEGKAERAIRAVLLAASSSGGKNEHDSSACAESGFQRQPG